MKAWFQVHPLLGGILGGILGVCAALVVWHLYVDHRDLHAVISFLNQAIQNQQQAAKPIGK